MNLAAIGTGTGEGQRARGGPSALLKPAFAAAVALAVSVAGIGGPSFWLDEAATITMND